VRPGSRARLFGWHQRSDPRLLQRNDPFGVNHWVGGAVGVVRDEHGGVPKWDELLKCKCDIDATLQELLDQRLVWNEARFCFVQDRDKNLGGNSLFRMADRIATEKRHLKRKWKAAHPLRGLQEPGTRSHPRPAPPVHPHCLTHSAVRNPHSAIGWHPRTPSIPRDSRVSLPENGDPHGWNHAPPLTRLHPCNSTLT